MIKTNTLIFTNLTPDIFNDNNTVIRDVLQPYSHLERLVAIKSFGRILAVFNDTNVAIQIKTTLHLTKLPGHDFIMGVYYGQHTDLHQLNQENNSNNLRVPELQKNFLISPPGSPAIGWIQTIESDPVSGGITEDICENAMSYVSLSDCFVMVNFSYVGRRVIDGS
jgi:hypothetical protein